MKNLDNPIPYMKHLITDEDKATVIKALESDYITQGPFVELVEEKMSQLTNKNYSVMCSNGTAALHLVAEMINQSTDKLNKNIIPVKEDKNFIYQKFHNAQEYGVDILNDLNGNFLHFTVKKKIAMRAGDTDRAIIVNPKRFKNFARLE